MGRDKPDGTSHGIAVVAAGQGNIKPRLLLLLLLLLVLLQLARILITNPSGATLSLLPASRHHLILLPSFAT